MAPKKRYSSHRRNSKSKQKKIDPKKFWGDPNLMEDLNQNQQIKLTPRADAVLFSLGRAPLSVPQHISEEHFADLYSKAVMLAGVLAAAGDLIEQEELFE